MAKKKKKQVARPEKRATSYSTKSSLQEKPWVWLIITAVITAIVFSPMLSNGFTNWDDQFYVTSNPMMNGPDWEAIFSRPLMANYHPLTVSSLALNYMVSGLQPFSYHFVNWLLHIANTVLVFWLAFRLADRNVWVATLTSLLFGLHPMHVESVAWVSERKDVMFTLFFLLSLLCYLNYIRKPDWKNYGGALVLFALSLLSKPAAVMLPLTLLLVDWYRGRSLGNLNVWLEKIPFFVLSLVFGLLTLKFQSAVKAIVAPDLFPFWQKIMFSFYGFGEYIRRMFWPFPLSAMHPFPESGVFPSSYIPAVIIGLVTIIAVWYFRNKRFLVFGFGFFAINIVLVLQLLTFGHAVIAERYTYVPYIGLAFALAMVWANSSTSPTLKKSMLIVALLISLGFAAISFQQVQVWKNSETLWSNVIKTYPRSYMGRSNRGQYLASKLSKFEEALADFEIALQVEPNDSFTLVNRATVYANQKNYAATLADGDSLVLHHPRIAKGYLFRGIGLNGLGNSEQAFEAFTQCIRRDSFVEEAWSNRGIISYNKNQDYAGAKQDFDYAIRINPKVGVYYKNRARCWIKFGNKTEALNDLAMATQLGEPVNDDLMNAAQALQ